MTDNFIETMKARVLQQEPIGSEDAMGLFERGKESPFHLFAAASEIREHFKGKTIILCGIVNAKSGRCSENCRFCAQSAHYHTSASVYPLLSSEQIIGEAKSAAGSGAHYFGIVTSGKKISGKEEWATIYEAIRGINHLGIKPCASLGMIDREKAQELKKAGLGPLSSQPGNLQELLRRLSAPRMIMKRMSKRCALRRRQGFRSAAEA